MARMVPLTREQMDKVQTQVVDRIVVGPRRGSAGGGTGLPEELGSVRAWRLEPSTSPMPYLQLIAAEPWLAKAGMS